MAQNRAHSRTTIKVGERLPADVELESFSEEVYRDVPTVLSYRYYCGDRGIYVVDPAQRIVIEEID